MRPYGIAVANSTMRFYIRTYFCLHVVAIYVVVGDNNN